MLQKSLLVTIALIVFYTVLIKGLGNHFVLSAQTQAQQNLITAERYLYQKNADFDTVLVGSSMSERILYDRLPGPCYNLAMWGASSMDGLKIIAQTNRWPRVIYIEMNTLARSWPADMLKPYYKPVWAFVYQHFPFMRHQYQPVGVVKSLLLDQHPVLVSTQETDMPDSSTTDPELYEKAVHEELVNIESKAPSDSALRANVTAAFQYVEQFRQHGVQVILYEVPESPRIQNHVLNVTTRRYLTNAFQASNYKIIPLPVSPYHTTDGVHMTPAEAIQYTNYLRQQLIDLK